MQSGMGCMFQFHKVRLKEKLEDIKKRMNKFQFHKVRLKVLCCI